MAKATKAESGNNTSDNKRAEKPARKSPANKRRIRTIHINKSKEFEGFM